MLAYTCAICKTEFRSLLIPRHQALKEVGELMQVHLKEKHMQEFTNFLQIDLPKITPLAAGVAMVNRFITFAPDDSISISEHQEHIDELMDMLGFDEEEDEDDDSESDSNNYEKVLEETKPIPVKDFLGVKIN